MAQPLNNASSFLAADHTSGSGTLVVRTGEGARFGTPSVGSPVLVTVASRSTLIGGEIAPTSLYTIFNVTGRSGDTLTYSGAVEGTADRNYRTNDPAAALITAGMLAALGGGLLPANNLSDIASATTARTNLGLGTAATHADTEYVHATGTETIAGAKTFSGTVVVGAAFVGSYQGLSTHAEFSHQSFAGSATNHGVIQDNTGNTVVNAANGRSVTLKNAGSTIATVDGTGLTVNLGNLVITSGNITSTGGKLTIAGKIATASTAVDGATITFNCAVTDWHSVTLGGNRTLAVTNDATRQSFTVELVQDATGSRTVTWWSGIKWAGGSAPTLTTTAAKADIFVFRKTGTGAYYGFVAGANL